jgi:hypothetical protein
MSSIIELMTAGEFRDLQVGEEGQSFGIVWIGDVVKYRVRDRILIRELTRLIRSP